MRPMSAVMRPGSSPGEEEGFPMFSRLGPWCHDRRKLVLGLWVAR
jgi:hypothetical protein